MACLISNLSCTSVTWPTSAGPASSPPASAGPQVLHALPLQRLLLQPHVACVQARKSAGTCILCTREGAEESLQAPRDSVSRHVLLTKVLLTTCEPHARPRKGALCSSGLVLQRRALAFRCSLLPCAQVCRLLRLARGRPHAVRRGRRAAAGRRWARRPPGGQARVWARV